MNTSQKKPTKMPADFLVYKSADQIVKKTIKDHKLIRYGDNLILGLSGGPDSLCLLHILSELRDEMGFDLMAFHLNHMIREDADDDEQYLTHVCSELEVPLTIARADVAAIAKQMHESVEETGRKIRQEELLKIAGGGKAVLAHNLDDQAETVMMRILRGTGLHGLAAMEYKRDDGVIRPLLDTPRVQIEKYCKQNGLQPRIDSTNSETIYTRNKIRLELLPQLMEEYNPAIKEALVRLSKNAREDDEFLDYSAELFMQDIEIRQQAVIIDRAIIDVIESTKDVEERDTPEKEEEFLSNLPSVKYIGLTVERKKLKALHPAILKRVVCKIFELLELKEDIASVHLNSFMYVLNNSNNKAIVEFPNGYRAEFARGEVRFYKETNFL